MKKTAVLLILLCLCAAFLNGCGAGAEEKYSMSFFGTFDTVVIIQGYPKDQDTFNRVTAEAKAMFERLHKVFDNYNAHEGVYGLYHLNREARNGPVPVEPELMDLLVYCKKMQPMTQGTVNVALGAVLSVWHDYRDEAEFDPADAKVPPMERLREAAEHTDFDDVVLDEKAGTVQYLDPDLKLDLGAVAKGYAAERVAQWMLQSEMPSFIISAGGNVRAGEPPRDGRLRWGVMVQNPDGSVFATAESDILDTLYLSNLSVVTSGDYQRFYLVDGKRYHHIISPQTLMPGEDVRAVTIVCEDSTYADLLSTALFLMPYEEGRTYVDGLDGVEALWVLPDGTVQMTEGMEKMARSHGAASK